MWGKAIVVVLLAVLANFYLGGRTERPSDAAKVALPHSAGGNGVDRALEEQSRPAGRVG